MLALTRRATGKEKQQVPFKGKKGGKTPVFGVQKDDPSEILEEVPRSRVREILSDSREPGQPLVLFCPQNFLDRRRREMIRSAVSNEIRRLSLSPSHSIVFASPIRSFENGGDTPLVHVNVDSSQRAKFFI